MIHPRELGRFVAHLCLAFALGVGLGCEDDYDGTEADEFGVGAQCSSTEDCTEADQECLTQFKGGYCGVVDCESDLDCPQASACVAHDDGNNYCFRTCTDKSECNRNRDPDVESNCSANVTFVDGGGGKACVPPSG